MTLADNLVEKKSYLNFFFFSLNSRVEKFLISIWIQYKGLGGITRLVIMGDKTTLMAFIEVTFIDLGSYVRRVSQWVIMSKKRKIFRETALLFLSMAKIDIYGIFFDTENSFFSSKMLILVFEIRVEITRATTLY